MSNTPNKLKTTHININSIRNKLDVLLDQVKGNVDILMISETKFDESFLVCQSKIDGFNTPYRVGRDQIMCGVTLYVWEHLPAKRLSIDRTKESCFVELNLKHTKRIISCSYNLNRSNIYSHLDSLSRSFDLYSSRCDNYLVLGNFNESVEEDNIKTFL